MKMFINKTNIKLLAAALLTALAAPSCMNLDETREGGYGYLTISGLDLDVQVEQLVPTKAGETTVDISRVGGYYNLQNLPSDVQNIVTVEKDGETCDWEGKALPYGEYTVKAACGSNDFGRPFYTCIQTVNIQSSETEVTLIYSLANSVMQVINGMNGHIDSSKQMTISSSEVSGEVKTGFGSYVFVPSGKSLTLSGSNAAGTGFSYTLGKLDPCKAYDVTLTPYGLPELELSGAQMLIGTTLTILTPATIKGSANSASIVYEATTDAEWNTANMKSSTVQNGIHVIEGLAAGSNCKVRARIGAIMSAPVEITPISVSADHSYTNGLLDGTDLKISNVPDGLKDMITFTLEKDGRTYRSGVKDSGEIDSDGSAITDIKGWPYLPKDTYELKATLTDNETVSPTMNVSVGAPTFTPTVSLGNTSYTSYDKYTANQITEANNCNAETLYSPSAVIGGISANLIKNSNYTKTISFAVDGTEKSIYNLTAMTHTGDNIPSLSWGSHTLTATFTFEGESITSSSKTHHITGLPHYAQPPSETLKWKMGDGEKNTWNTEYAMISTDGGRGYPDIISPEFNVPSDKMININIYPDIRRNYYWTGVAKGDLQITKIANDGSENDLYKQELAREKTMTSTLSTSFNGGTNKFRIQYCYAATGPETYIYKFNVLYANK